MTTKNYSLQDFSLINTYLEKYKNNYWLTRKGDSFYFFALDYLLWLQDDEIKSSITDTNFLSRNWKEKWHDRWIDAVYIDYNKSQTPIVHLFNFKFTEKFENTKNNFPSWEIDKIVSFINSIMSKDENLKNEINQILYWKVQEIWDIFNSWYPKFVLHFCANHYEWLAKQENERLKNSFSRYKDFNIEFNLMEDFVNLITKSDKKIINWKIRVNKDNLFMKSDWDIRALVIKLDVKDIIKIVLDNEEIRNNVDIDYSDMNNCDITEDVFEDNVRLYLRQRTNINKWIKKTLLSDESKRFFYYNNWITITCKHFEYPPQVQYPILILEDIQVVNWSQTIHSLYEAFLEDNNYFNGVDVLCRIYETNNSELSSKIAEYTNSQNPVKTRDIRSIDFVQQKLEKELSEKWYFYERKRNQYLNEDKNKRLDAEKIWQILMSYNNKMPSEAKNTKSLIFSDEYNNVFNDNITANEVILLSNLYKFIELKVSSIYNQYIESDDENFYNDKWYLLYSSYYNLYIISELSFKFNIDVKDENFDNLFLYSIKIIEKLIEIEKSKLEKWKIYSHPTFFKSNNPKKHFESLSEKDIKTIIWL